jgi:hypothetical protein
MLWCWVAPIPRYLTTKCCDDPGHTDNYNREDFESEISSGIGIHKRLLESWAHELNMNYRIVDATELVDPAEPIVWNRTTRGGIPLWFHWDPVHLVQEAYQKLADAVVTAGSTDESDTASESVSTTSSAIQSRKRPESVVTVPRACQPPNGGKKKKLPRK